MAEKLYPTRHTTIGSVIDAGLRIRGTCFDCYHSEDIDLQELAHKLGRKFSSLPMYLVPKLVCSQCGSKHVGTALVPADADVPDEQMQHVRERLQAGEPTPESENQ